MWIGELGAPIHVVNSKWDDYVNNLRGEIVG